MTNAATPLLVLGATSLIGRFLPGVADGRPLQAVSRRAPGREGYLWTQADLSDPEVRLPASAEALALCPIWVTAAALPAIERAGVQRIVAVSSTSRWTKVASPDPGERAVAARLAQGEAALARFAAVRDWRWTVLRPTLIYAEGLDANISRLADLVRRFGVLPLSGDGGGLRQPVHAQDLARATLEALASDAASGRAYDLPGGETLTYRRMVERVFEALGRRPRVIVAPPTLWRAGLALARPWLPGATAVMGERMAQDLTFDGRPATRDFGWAPRAFRPDFTPSRPVSAGDHRL